MRLVSYYDGTGSRVGVLTDDGVAATDATDMLQVIRSGELPHATSAPRPVAGLRLLAPLPRPGKLLFCAVNYASQKQEDPSATLPAEPFFFASCRPL